MNRSLLTRVFFPLLALLAAAAPAAAQPVADFSPVEYVVSVDGSVIAADVFNSNQAGAILVLSGELEAPVLLRLRQTTVETVNLMKVDRRADGGVTLLPDPGLAQYGAFRVSKDGTGVDFTVAGRNMSLREKPPLLGAQKLAGMRAYSSEYVARADDYSPSAPLLARLRKEGRPVRVEVFFGTWCPFCQQMVPRMMRVAGELAGSKIDFDFYGLPRQIKDDARAVANGIDGVPTGIVYVGGKEIGRISGSGWKVPELALNNILVRGG